MRPLGLQAPLTVALALGFHIGNVTAGLLFA